MEDNQLLDRLPSLNRYALYLTKNRDDAQDLVQITVLTAIERIRKDGLHVENPAPYMSKMMYWLWVKNFVIKREKQRAVEYEDYMGSEPPQQNYGLLTAKLSEIINAHKPHNKNLLLRFLEGEDWPKMYKATRDFKIQAREILQ